VSYGSVIQAQADYVLPPQKEKASCFSALDTVQLSNGEAKPFANVAIGDEILTLSQSGSLEYSPVLYLPHGPNDAPATVVELLLEGGRRSLRLTPDHLVAALRANECRSMASQTEAALATPGTFHGAICCLAQAQRLMLFLKLARVNR
jgi:hypothetical protein